MRTIPYTPEMDVGAWPGRSRTGFAKCFAAIFVDGFRSLKQPFKAFATLFLTSASRGFRVLVFSCTCFSALDVRPRSRPAVVRCGAGYTGSSGVSEGSSWHIHSRTLVSSAVGVLSDGAAFGRRARRRGGHRKSGFGLTPPPLPPCSVTWFGMSG